MRFPSRLCSTAEPLGASNRITIIGCTHPSANPRLVRNADALSAAGFDVRVLGVRFRPRLVAFDDALLASRSWRFESVDFLSGVLARVRWQRARARVKVCAALARKVAIRPIDARATTYGVPELTRLALREPAALYIAQHHAMLPVAAAAAEACGGALAFDAEDLLVESPTEPTALLARHEDRFLGRCAFVLTMSDVAAERLTATRGLVPPAVALHNTQMLAERGRLVRPSQRGPRASRSVYWFGQTLGPHSRAEQVLHAFGRMTSDVTLVLRGNPIARYVDELKNLAARLGVSHRLRLEPPAPPESMVELAGEHDVLFGSQPGIDNFHQLALGNKVFTGMTAGLALALTDTVAHRRLACSLDGAAFLVPDQDAEALAKLLDGLFGDPARLMAAKDAAWDAATTRYNWDREGVILADLAREAVANRSTLAHRDTA